MRIDLDFVELHTPLFLGGMSLNNKLYWGTKGNKNNVALELWYDTELEHTFVVFGEHVAIIETTASKTIKYPNLLKLEKRLDQPKAYIEPMQSPFTGKAQVSGPGLGLKSAQISTPMDKVQGVPGKKAKYQGEVVE